MNNRCHAIIRIENREIYLVYSNSWNGFLFQTFLQQWFICSTFIRDCINSIEISRNQCMSFIANTDILFLGWKRNSIFLQCIGTKIKMCYSSYFFNSKCIHLRLWHFLSLIRTEFYYIATTCILQSLLNMKINIIIIINVNQYSLNIATWQ